MKKVKIEIEVIKTDTGRIRIVFDGCYSVMIPDDWCNVALISAFESEVKD